MAGNRHVDRIRWAAPLLLPLLALAPGCRPRPPEPIPILMYHHLASKPGDNVWTVSTEEFRRQIADLKAAGYQTILPRDLAKVRRWKFWLPRQPIVITFDDGLLSTMIEAEPVLRGAGFQAVCYLILGLVADTPAERKKYLFYDCLTWEDVQAMLVRGTFAFGIHSFSHTPDPARQAQEVRECRNIFQRKTGSQARDFCYPYGSAPALLVDAVSNAGYRTAMVCEDKRFLPGPGADLFRIPRVSVYGGDHGFSVSPVSGPEGGFICAEAINNGVPVPVRGVLRDRPSGRTWPLQPAERLGPAPQRWCWTNLPSGLDAAALQAEIWEQNRLFRYHP